MPKEVESVSRKKHHIRILVPQSKEEAAALLEQVGNAQDDLDDIQRDFADEVAGLKAEVEREMDPRKLFISEASRALLAFAEANRLELTGNGKRKTILLSTGKLSWRTTPASIKFTKKKKDVLAMLQKLGLWRFIRRVETPDKEAMLREPEVAETLDCVRISQSEYFVLEPEGRKEVKTRLYTRRKR